MMSSLSMVRPAQVRPLNASTLLTYPVKVRLRFLSLERFPADLSRRGIHTGALI